MPEDLATPAVSVDASGMSGMDAMSADLDALDASPEESSSEIETAAEETPQVESATDDAIGEPLIDDGASSEDEPEPLAAEDEKPEAKAGEEELPEGVRLIDKDGKKEYRLREARYRLFESAHHKTQAAENILGEELTSEAIQSRQDAWTAQEAMMADYMSGDPESETRFLHSFAQWGKQAQDNGEIQHDPLRSIAERLPEYLAKNGHGETLEAMATPLFRMQLDHLYKEAATLRNNNLKLALQHVDQALFNQYKTEEQIAALANPNPVDKRLADLEAREKKLKDFEANTRRAEYTKWQDATNASIKGAVAAQISEVLKPVEAAYKQFPKEFEGIQNLLRSELQSAMKRDVPWQQYLKTAERRAANAVSPSVRDAVTADLEARIRAKAKHVLDPSRNPNVKEILNQRAAAMKAQSDARHARLKLGAERREPGATGNPVKQTIRTLPNGTSTSEAFADFVDQQFG